MQLVDRAPEKEKKMNKFENSVFVWPTLIFSSGIPPISLVRSSKDISFTPLLASWAYLLNIVSISLLIFLLLFCFAWNVLSRKKNPAAAPIPSPTDREGAVRTDFRAVFDDCLVVVAS